MRKIAYAIAAALAMGVVSLLPAMADDDGKSAKEYLVKAAFLYNFVKFVEWPGEQALARTHTANICILGDAPFGSALDLFTKASSAQLAFVVRRGIQETDIPACQVLFISESEEERLGSILGRTQGYPVLTVSEIKGFADHGGIIELATVEKNIGLFSKDKINLRVNLKTAREKGLRIDAQLLEIAAEVIR